MKTAIQIHAADTVATAVEEVAAGEEVRITGIGSARTLTVRDAIPSGHKIALVEIPEGTEILKYGEVIGAAVTPIRAGGWVHVHNCSGLKARRFGG